MLQILDGAPSTYPLHFIMASRNKRQRYSEDNGMQLTDLPNALISDVAVFLPQASCISFLYALSSHDTSNQISDSHQPSAISMAIAARQNCWENIEFKGIQDLCGQNGILSDNDIRWVLSCVGVQNIKSIKLSHCYGITGSGLDQIRHSAVLKSIDLSLVGDHESGFDLSVEQQSTLSEITILSILNNILENEDSSLEHVQLPQKWRKDKSVMLNTFLERMEYILTRRRIKCSKEGCGGTCNGHRNFPVIHWREDDPITWSTDRYGAIGITCYMCLKNYCHGCQNRRVLKYCDDCEKFYCQDCIKVEHCRGQGCRASCCSVCDFVKKCVCGMTQAFCSDCRPSSWVNCLYCDEGWCSKSCAKKYMNICDGCGKRANCNGNGKNNCVEGNSSLDCVTKCEECGSIYCSNCRALRCSDKKENCPACMKSVKNVKACRANHFEAFTQRTQGY